MKCIQLRWLARTNAAVTGNIQSNRAVELNVTESYAKVLL